MSGNESSMTFDEDKTILEDEDSTIIENSLSEKVNTQSNTSISFQNYSIKKQFSTSGAEADIYLVEKDTQEFVLKLYRYGISPKEEVFSKIKKISDNYPEYFVKIYETGFDNQNNRWYELQEYVKHESLKEFKITENDIKGLIEKIADALNILHNENILHLDLKPANLLIRNIAPPDIVITDFGISSILDSEISRKMTTIKGTPMYWSPESFTGVVGRETDYWSLGIIILEILMGKHPFSKMEQQVIMYTLSTKGVEIPETINEEYKLLLRGLLTRDPKKRWCYDEINKWLGGEKNLKVFYETKDDKNSFDFPYEFKGEKYYSLQKLTTQFISNEASWEEAVSHLSKGYIEKWLEKNEDYSNAVTVEKIKSSGDNFDYALLKMIYKFNNKLPFVIYGKYITLQNLYIYFAKSIRREETEIEKNIVQTLLNGDLLALYRDYLDFTEKDKDELFYFLELMEKTKLNKDKQKTYQCLNYIFEPDKYSLKRFKELNILVPFVVNNFENIVTDQEISEITATYNLPKETHENLFETKPEKFSRALKDFRYLKENNYLIEKNETRKIFNNYILPKELKNHLSNSDVKEFIVAIGVFKRILNENLLITEKELNSIINTYDLPANFEEGIKSNSLKFFIDSMINLKNMQDNQLLIEKKEIEDLDLYFLPEEIKRNIKTEHMPMYLETVRNIKYLKKNSLLISHKKLDNYFSIYQLPKTIIDNIRNDEYSRFLDAVKSLKDLDEKKLLIYKNKFEALNEVAKKKILDGSISDYISASISIKQPIKVEVKKNEVSARAISIIAIILIVLIFLIYKFFV